ncbi:protein-associating with the carboxyl-terminal domain of ezrin isoform X1 [Cuculus canorus]|uniref:protein-associating with the carboxyl-terminal domain of ezrin isoform X1 n=1 Tax=Cuculus canorus TaxID=55661 RepID=UPI0023AAADF9|nr:protein-associating with the carboxyl-terminal domain of ezrin isoform X1 [Cuculus canorus]XP_053928755.1 protein-associating with the carboxyl-terminal domain of ezrin isoform X1 [Cuculus canorus]XP_053928756.1 protein-associating with the carboxyl-terminal domain of ezrin isoform X1 [Cuculus canorus]
MGSENSALKSYALEEPPFTLPTGHTIYPAVLQDGKLASVFVYKRENEDKVNKAAKHLKTLRHPCLLRFLSCIVEANGIHLVTERVKPLEMVLETLSSAEICAGIYDVLLALIFLHDRGRLTHNNVCLSSVFVSEDGHWKLGGMETVCNFSEATPEFLYHVKLVRDQSSIPCEEMSADFKMLPSSYGHARDAYAFGTMVETLLTVLNDQVSADILSSFQQTLHSTLLNPDPKCRPPLSSLLSHEFFRNDFLEVVNFLKTLTLKSEEEKTEFFKFLLDRVAGLSEELIASRLVPLLLNQLVFAEPVAVKSFLPHLLGPKKEQNGESQTSCLLSPALFQTHVIPVLLKLFEVHEEHVRMVLLSHIHAYAELFSQEELKNIILPQVLLGLRDTSDSIVAITLHSLAVLVSLLGPEVVVGGERTKIFKSSAPSFMKTADLSPEASPSRIVSNQRNRTTRPLKNSSVFPVSGSVPVKKLSVQQDNPLALKTSEQFVQSPLNGIPGSINMLGSSRNSLTTSEKPVEEWPDWSEPEETDTEKTVNIQIQPREPQGSVGPYFAEHDVDEKPWDDFEPSSPSPDLSSGNCITVTQADTVERPRPPPGTPQLSKEFRSLRLSPPAKSCPGNSWSNNKWDHQEQLGETLLPKMTFQERLKSSSDSGLGEEFTIKVKRKPVQDPELDWFADMIPDIKPSSILILPEVRTEVVVPSPSSTVSSREGASQNVLFSSKFAAADVIEAEAAGWGEEEELNWEDDTNW